MRESERVGSFPDFLILAVCLFVGARTKLMGSFGTF